ncbi:MAG: helix-turn-helix domain-containing protein [Clostridia bacterium]|nr:helix-turn-helix domain-containing protein [Clostridia bacterium]
MSTVMSRKDAYNVMFKEYPDVVTVNQMGCMLRISSKTAYRLLKENKVDHFMVGRAYKIPKIHIISYLHVLQDL